MDRSKIGFVVGLAAEARLLDMTGCAVEIGGGTAPGAARAVAGLIGRKAGAIISFGLAGGLNPALPPGALLIPEAVLDGGTLFHCDAELLRLLGGATCKSTVAEQAVVATVARKQALFAQTGADAVDLESGAVARAAAGAGIPFAVLRAVADPAARDLPPAALVALSGTGRIGLLSVLASVLKQPGQIPALLAVGRDAAKARGALVRKLRATG